MSFRFLRGLIKKKYKRIHGKSTFFTHVFSALFFFQVSWVRHKDVNLISVGKFKYISDDRFSIVHEDHDETWVLTIK